MKTLLFLAFSACVATSGLSATVRDVIVRSRWPWNNKIDIRFVLETEKPVDITLAATTNGVPMTIPTAAIAGDLLDVVSGVRALVIDPSKVGLPAAEKLVNFAVTLTPTTAKTYMIVDLSDGLANTAAARITYTNEVIGTKSASNDDATWRLWDDYYKTNAIVFRRCLAGTFLMGSPATEYNRVKATGTTDDEKQHRVKLTRPFYIGVFEVTQKQWARVLGKRQTCFFTADWEMRPQEQLTFYGPRGDNHENWPDDDVNKAHAVGDGFFKSLRTLTGGDLLFDYPTEAQWEYACRAGTTTALYDGHDLPTSVGWNGTQCDYLDPLARYLGTVSTTSPTATTSPLEGGTAIVGSYRPNNWGLYDMLGNVWEWCLDRKEDWLNVADSVVDPVGPASGSNRLRRGGSYISGVGNNANRATCAARSSSTVADNGKYQGFRASVTLY